MQALIEHLVKPIVAHPGDLSIQEVEGDSVTIYEIVVNPEDRAVFEAEDDRVVRAIRNVLSAGAGRKKVTFELVDAHAEASEE